MTMTLVLMSDHPWVLGFFKRVFMFQDHLDPERGLLT